jgi:hypothetical protein
MADPALRAEIAKGASLSHAETVDKSAPNTNIRGAVLGEIAKPHDLKHTETTDKSAPVIEGDVHVKKVDRAGFLSEVQGEHKLAHVETVDKSVPATEGASVGQSKLPALLQEIKAAK